MTIKDNGYKLKHFEELKKTEKLDVQLAKFSPRFVYWTKTLIRLIFQIIIIAFVVFTLVFFLTELIPGDPKIIEDLRASKVDPSVIAALEESFGLNKSIFERYIIAIGNMFNGSLGVSGTYGVDVSSFLWPKLLLSLQIGFISLAMSALIGIPIGVALARRKSTTSDVFATAFSIIAFAVPAFVIAIIFTLISYLLGFPIVFEYGNWYTILLPAFVIAIPVGLTYSRYLRSSIREEYNKQYVALARVKGASEKRVFWGHIFKPSLYPIVTYLPILVIAVLFGSITVETVFAIPGAGDLMVSAAIDRDQATLVALSTIYTVFIIFSFFVRDLLIQFIDPRVRTD